MTDRPKYSVASPAPRKKAPLRAEFYLEKEGGAVRLKVRDESGRGDPMVLISIRESDGSARTHPYVSESYGLHLDEENRLIVGDDFND